MSEFALQAKMFCDGDLGTFSDMLIVLPIRLTARSRIFVAKVCLPMVSCVKICYGRIGVRSVQVSVQDERSL